MSRDKTDRSAGSRPAVHRRYAGIIHATRKRSGHFWQGGFGCAVMDEDHFAAAVVYVMLNPVRAARGAGARLAMVERARLSKKDGLTQTQPVLERFPDMGEMLKHEADADALRRLRAAKEAELITISRNLLVVVAVDCEPRNRISNAVDAWFEAARS